MSERPKIEMREPVSGLLGAGDAGSPVDGAASDRARKDDVRPVTAVRPGIESREDLQGLLGDPDGASPISDRTRKADVRPVNAVRPGIEAREDLQGLLGEADAGSPVDADSDRTRKDGIRDVANRSGGH